MGGPGIVAARAALTAASYQACARSLSRGQVKRVMRRGPLVGYCIACPACGFSAPYLDDDAGFQEREEGGAALLVGVDRPPACMKCARLLRVRDGQLEAVDP